MGEFANRMKDEMSIRGFADETQKAYLACMRSFVKFCGQAPDKITEGDINRFQIHLTKERKVSWSRFNQHVCAIMFFYRHVIKKPWVISHIPYHKREKRLPVVLSRQEILKLLESMPNIRHRALFLTIYSTGLTGRGAGP